MIDRTALAGLGEEFRRAGRRARLGGKPPWSCSAPRP
jgi:hypothetical protein